MNPAQVALAETHSLETVLHKPTFTPILLDEIPQVLKTVKAKGSPPRAGGYNPCWCLDYAKWYTGINIGSFGYAARHPVNSRTPQIGAIGFSYESSLGHAWVVIGIDETHVTLAETNYVQCTTTTGRRLPINSPLIRGYWVQ